MLLAFYFISIKLVFILLEFKLFLRITFFLKSGFILSEYVIYYLPILISQRLKLLSREKL